MDTAVSDQLSCLKENNGAGGGVVAHIWGSSRLQAVADHTEIIGSLAEQHVSNFAQGLRTADTMINMRFSNVASVA